MKMDSLFIVLKASLDNSIIDIFVVVHVFNGISKHDQSENVYALFNIKVD